MPRHANLGNGSLLVTLDGHGLVHDLYFPYVGMENHVAFQHFHRIGVYDMEAKAFSWLHEKSWKAEMKYEEDSLICLTEIKNEEMGLTLLFRDGVHMQENIFIRSIKLVNESERKRVIKLFFHQDFHLYGEDQQNTALFAPEIKNPKKDGALLHYRQRRYFLMNGFNDRFGVEEFSVGKVHYKNLEGTWKDAEDGELDGNAIDQGSVDSVMAFTHELGPQGVSHQYYWMCAGKSHREVQDLNTLVINNTPEHLLNTTSVYWSNWSNRKVLGCVRLDQRIMKLVKQSLLIIRTQIDNHGAIIAANDSDIMAFNKDTYTYMWPRDGALVAHALDMAGHFEVTRRFFEFCSTALSDNGYMLHKYNPDGSVGSSWHPWFRDGKPMLPIQEDETALVLYALDYHYQQFQDIEFIRSIYHSFIKLSSEFLESFVSEPTGLPLPSYDLWEEHYGIHTWTVSTTIAGLRSAHKLALLMGHPESAARYLKRAEKMTESLKKYLWNEEGQRFYKTIKIDEKGEVIDRDTTVESSTMGVSLFGVLSANDPMVVKNNEAVGKYLWVPGVGGLARYQGDGYQRTGGDEHAPGNPWLVTTLWHALWIIDRARKPEEMNKALELINWVADTALSTGVLPEQVDAGSGQHISVSPLTWSHAAFVETVLKYCQKLEEFGVCNLESDRTRSH